MSFSEYTNKTVHEVFEMLKTSESGLSKKEALLRQKEYGLNEIKSDHSYIFNILLRQFSSPFFYLLFITGAVTLLIGEKIESVVILVFVAANIFIGFIQEFRAEHTISLLKKLIPQKVKVLRNEKEEIIEKKYLVLGDLVQLSPGDIIPAELRVFESQNFFVDESALTGESIPVEKTGGALLHEKKEIFKAQNILFAGTSVIAGNAKAFVVNTGLQTQLGQIIKLTKENNHRSAYEKNLLYFCRLILKIVVTTVVLIFLLNLIIKGTASIFEFLIFCIALMVSILPEALPAVVIFALSRGSLKMAKENVVVKRLSSIEDLGNIEILCTDKTGTITQNKLSSEKVICENRDTAILYGLLGADVKSQKSYFDSAIFSLANHGILKDIKTFNVLSEVTFDSFRMRSSVLVQKKPVSLKSNTNTNQKILITKGAPEFVLKLCSKFSGDYKRNEILKDITREGHDGKRVLVVAFKEINKEEITAKDEKGLTFLGYFVFEDPLKSTASEAIRLAKKLGVVIKIITGDAKEVAGFVAKTTGLITNQNDVILGQDLEKMHTDEFDNACEDNAVFARVSPEIKHKIIKSLQKKYEVGFLGEGINDAPALKTADVGIAVAGATDIAREASDVVLLQKDLRVIIDGIKNGRNIFSNINKYIKLTLASNFGNFYSIATISLFINFLPMLPIQILLTNLLSDFPLISIATDSVDIEELRKPKAYQLHTMLPLIVTLALVSTVFDFVFFFIFYKHAPAQIQTLWFIESILTELLLIFIIRTRHVFWKAKKPSFYLIFFTIIDGLAVIILPFTKLGQRFFYFVAPPLYSLLIVLLLIISYIIVSEFAKLIYFRSFMPSKANSLHN